MASYVRSHCPLCGVQLKVCEEMDEDNLGSTSSRPLLDWLQEVRGGMLISWQVSRGLYINESVTQSIVKQICRRLS